MEEGREIRKGNMADVICHIATILAENGCDPEQLWQLEAGKIAPAKNLLAFIKAWVGTMEVAMPTVVLPNEMAWINAEKKCTMMTQCDYSIGTNQAILSEVRRLQGTPDMTVAEPADETEERQISLLPHTPFQIGSVQKQRTCLERGRFFVFCQIIFNFCHREDFANARSEKYHQPQKRRDTLRLKLDPGSA